MEEGNDEEFDDMMDQLLERDGSNDPPILADVIEQSMIDADDTQHDSQVDSCIHIYIISKAFELISYGWSQIRQWIWLLLSLFYFIYFPFTFVLYDKLYKNLLTEIQDEYIKLWLNKLFSVMSNPCSPSY